MKAELFHHNRVMGRLQDFYDLLVSRRAPLAYNEVTASPSKVDNELIDLLEITDADYILIDRDDQILANSESVSSIGLIKNGRIATESIRKLVRNARLSKDVIETEVAIPRSVLSNGFHERRVRIHEIGQNGMVAVLIFDDSEARRLDAVRRDFVANISHELKTPIGGISILAEAISEGSEDPELVKNFASRMQIEATRLSHLVQEIIDLSRIQDQNTMQNSQLVSLNKIVEEAIYQCRIRAEKRRVQINLSQDEEIDFYGDRKQLVMAISNLVDNAINYSPEATTVSVLLRKNSEAIEISVSDQGVGIAEPDLDRIFERFYRVDQARSRETGGTGLGLSIVKHVISNHGGDIQVWSVVGTGSTFTVLLPLQNINQLRLEEKIDNQ